MQSLLLHSDFGQHPRSVPIGNPKTQCRAMDGRPDRGRFIRKKPSEENRADIVWFLDRQHPVLLRGSDAMLTRLR